VIEPHVVSLLFRGDCPTDLFLQVVALVVRKYTVVLQPAHDYPGRYAQLMCESADCPTTASTKTSKNGVILLWNEPFKRKRICLRLLRVSFLVVAFQKVLSLSMQKSVASFVKEREPQMVISFVPEAQLDKGARGSEPPGGTPGSRSG
jgi:hypothetical protein